MPPFADAAIEMEPYIQEYNEHHSPIKTLGSGTIKPKKTRVGDQNKKGVWT